jgi:hypothetical protein
MWIADQVRNDNHEWNLIIYWIPDIARGDIAERLAGQQFIREMLYLAKLSIIGRLLTVNINNNRILT